MKETHLRQKFATKMFLVQWMEAGESGVSGVYAVRVVNKENIPGHENATHQLHNMVERNAKETLVKLRIAIKMFRVQSMATGENGVNGPLAARRANKESRQEIENVIHLIHSMEERNAWETRVICKFATTTFLVQLMETGDNGVHGAPAANLADKENILENENVIHQLHNMVERNAKEKQPRKESVTRISHVLSMEIGESGANGVNAVRLVNREIKHGNAYATRRLQTMVGRSVLAIPRKLKFATEMSLVQWMEIGESGVSGVSVARRVNKESNPGNENAITHLQSMAGRNVKDIQVRSECAMKMFHVQSTETGEIGADGALAQRLVNKASNHENVNATHLSQNMVERPAQVTQVKARIAKKMSHVQLTVTGETGASGANARRLANRDSNQDSAYVTTQLLSMAGGNVRVNQANNKSAMEMFLVQSMEIGVCGANGVNAVRPVNMELKQENANVTRRLQSMVERSVLVIPREHKSATKMSLVQWTATGDLGENGANAVRHVDLENKQESANATTQRLRTGVKNAKDHSNKTVFVSKENALLMESGVNGALGVNVVNRVNKDSDHGAENVTHQFRSTMETPVMEIPNRRFHAMRIFLVQLMECGDLGPRGALVVKRVVMV